LGAARFCRGSPDSGLVELWKKGSSSLHISSGMLHKYWCFWTWMHLTYIFLNRQKCQHLGYYQSTWQMHYSAYTLWSYSIPWLQVSQVFPLLISSCEAADPNVKG
jgi:hypothetical protein